MRHYSAELQTAKERGIKWSLSFSLGPIQFESTRKNLASARIARKNYMSARLLLLAKVLQLLACLDFR